MKTSAVGAVICLGGPDIEGPGTLGGTLINADRCERGANQTFRALTDDSCDTGVCTRNCAANTGAKCPDVSGFARLAA